MLSQSSDISSPPNIESNLLELRMTKLNSSKHVLVLSNGSSEWYWKLSGTSSSIWWLIV